MCQTGIMSGMATALVIATAKYVVPRKVGHTTCKAVMGFQFLGAHAAHSAAHSRRLCS